MQQILQDNSTSLKLLRIPIPKMDLEVVCNTRTGRIRHLVPQTLQNTLFSSMHNLLQPCAKAAIQLVTDLCRLACELKFDSGRKLVCYFKRPKQEDTPLIRYLTRGYFLDNSSFLIIHRVIRKWPSVVVGLTI